MAKNDEKNTKKKLFLLGLPKASPLEIKEFRDNLRPFCRQFNVILTQTKVEPMNLEDFKQYLEGLLEGVKDMLQTSSESPLKGAENDKNDEKVSEPTPEQKEALKRIRAKAIKVLEENDGKNPQGEEKAG